MLWGKDKESVPAKLFNSFVSEALIEDKSSGSDSYQSHGFTVKFATSNDLGLIFVAVYQSILQLPYVEELLENMKKIFLALFSAELKAQRDSGIIMTIDDFEQKQKFGDMISARIKELESSNSKASIPVISDVKSVAEEEGDNSEQDSTPAQSGTSTPTVVGGSRRRRGGKKKKEEKLLESVAQNKKKMRKWGVNGEMEEDYEAGPLDYSSSSANGQHDTHEEIIGETVGDIENWGQVQKGGAFVLKELHGILDDDQEEESIGASAGSFGFLKSFMGGSKLSAEELDKTLADMESHLLKKNVAKEAAEHLCEAVKKALVGTKTQNWTSVKTTVKKAMADALRRIITPSTSLDLLHEIEMANKKGSRPYVISVVGVNGVGKSTNLSKIAFWLLQNKKKVLIAACDTFRSGAVEQLKVHVDRLKQLTSRLGAGEVEIFSEGYGKDAAVIAQRAVEFGQKGGFDVVLIDTAGRRHNDDRLMSNLEKFGKLANPNKIIMVGEALVGTDSVQQARNFNAAFGSTRNLDFFLISKCDTVGDMIGSIVNMTYSTGIPVLFVGVGQNYTDLRTLSIDWAVDLLMK